MTEKDIRKPERSSNDLLKQAQAIFAEHEAVILLIDPDSGRICDANPAASAFYRYSKEELLGMSERDISSLGEEELASMRRSALDRKRMHFTVPHKRRNGETRQVDIYACPVRYDGEELLCSIIFDVTSREESYREMASFSYRDYLTGLYNRRYFDEALHSLDKPENLPICIVMADMNGLKTVNEIFGHEAGDKALVRAAVRLREAAGPNGVAARIGGDEFALVIPYMREPDVLQMIDTLKKLEAGEKVDEVPVSVSIGYQLKRSAGENILDVLTEAEKFLFRHKIYESASLRNLSVDLVMNALCEKSAREREHSSRTSYLAEEIARLLEMSQPQLFEIRIAALLHDIGKIGIPESILNKPGRLADDELNILKKHSEIGWRILGSSVDYKEIAKIVLHQHERWDGKGYPGGLAGEDIPLASRIIAVADAYDVMTGTRPYRPQGRAQNEACAREELQKNAGSQFDPHIIRVFSGAFTGLIHRVPWFSRAEQLLKKQLKGPACPPCPILGVKCNDRRFFYFRRFG